MSNVILGIDLGTTNTVVAVTQGEHTLVLADEAGNRIQPSVVAFHPNGEVMIGRDAKARRAIDPRNTLFSIKRLIGRGMLARETREMCERMPFEIGEGTNQQPMIKTRAGEFSAPEVQAFLLRRIKKIAEAALGHEVRRAVITVPASFNEAQRQATAAAGTIAGLDVASIINEPTAAAVAFAFRKNLSGTIAVYDFGGGTFDISILRVNGDRFEVMSSAGDPFLGGDDIDNLLVRRMAKQFLELHKVDPLADPMAVQRLQGVAEKVKIELASRTRSLVDVEELAYGEGGRPLGFQVEITRGELETEASPLIRQTFPVCDEALHRAGVAPNSIDALVLVGGTTKMPLVQQMVSKYFGREARTDVNPDEAVAVGAALQGSTLSALSPPLPSSAKSRPARAPRKTAPGLPPPPIPQPDEAGETEITAEYQGEQAKTLGKVGTVKRAVAPVAAIEKRSDTETEVRRHDFTREATGTDTAVAAAPTDTAVTAAPTDTAVTAASSLGPIIFDITPQALGLATVAGYCEHIIKPNAPVPAKVMRTFATSKDDQREVRLRICQGNGRMMDENVALGMLILDGLAPAPRGRVKIDVEFKLDASGRLHVRASDPKSGVERKATLEVIGVQTSEEVSAARARLQDILP